MYTQKVVQSKRTLHVAYVTGDAICAGGGCPYSEAIILHTLLFLYHHHY